MIGATCKTRFDSRKVLRRGESATGRYLSRAGATVRKVARWSIRQRQTASAAGLPPHTRRGQLRRSVLYAVDRMSRSVVIGPSANVVGTSGKAHEFGGRYRHEKFPQRPFMGPALRRVEPSLPAMWADSYR